MPPCCSSCTGGGLAGATGGELAGLASPPIRGGGRLFAHMTYRRFLRKGAEALVPHFVDGKWRRPMVSAREAARLRKVAITDGTYGSFELGKGGWLPDWDFKYTDRPKILKPNKGHKRERTREERFQKIQTAMEGMDDKIRKHKEALVALKPKPGIENLFKKLTSSARRR